MSLDTAVDWGLRAIMALATVFVFLLGRDQKRSEELIQVKADAIKDNLRNELALRDQQMGVIERRLDAGGEKLSALASFAQGFGGREERLRREIGEAARAAKHQAVDAVVPLIADLNLRKMDERLHSEQVDDLRRRLGILEDRA